MGLTPYARLGMIDLHTHVLPGVDDGPADLDGSLHMASVAQAVGIETLVATPHVSHTWPETTPEGVADAVAALQPELNAAGIGVRVVAGAEVAITRGIDLPDEELQALRLGGGEWLLAECPLSPSAIGAERLLLALQARGHRILLGHPERSAVMQKDPAMVARLVEAGMLCSITAGTLVGQFGRTAQTFAMTMLEEGLVHNVTSDAHDALRRPPGIRAALAAADETLPGVLDLAGWMTEDVPRAVLGGAPIPPAPAPPPRRARRRGLLARLSGGRAA